MEMSGTEITSRMTAALGRINMHQVHSARISDDDWPRLTSAVSLLNDAPIFIDDTPQLTVMDLCNKARSIKKENGLGLIIIDSLQLIIDDKDVTNVARSLKSLAKELDVPIIVVSHLNRDLEKRADKRPVLSDLPDSYALDESADVIVFIYRDEMYNKNSPEMGLAEIIIAKQRSGPVGKILLSFFNDYARFENWTTGS